MYFYILGVHVIKLGVNNEINCVFNKHHIIFRRYSNHPWNIACSVGLALSKHGYGKMPQKRHMFWSSEYLISFTIWLHAKNLKDKPIGGDI